MAQNDEAKVSVFPIPCNVNVLHVVLEKDMYGKAVSIELRNFIGKRLQVKKVQSKETLFDEMSFYPEGLYVIMVRDVSGKILETVKFMIAK